METTEELFAGCLALAGQVAAQIPEAELTARLSRTLEAVSRRLARSAPPGASPALSDGGVLSEAAGPAG
jgi:hypothetical protein